jgi:hypothetical protein
MLHLILAKNRAAFFRLALLVALSAGVAACEAESSTPAAKDVVTAGTDAATGETAGDTAGEVATGPMDMCQGTEDLAWLKATLPSGQTGRELAREAAGDCGLGCLNNPAPDKCAIKCMKESVGVQLSDGCAGCYGGIVLCTINKCLPKCIDDAQAQICKDCQETKGCNAPFYACTGPLD